MNLSEKIACTHCHLQFDASYLIKETTENEDVINYFCCKGCQGIFHLLKDNGLDSFYDKVGDTLLSPPKINYEDSSNFNIHLFTINMFGLIKMDFMKFL